MRPTSPHDGRSRAPLRWVLATVLAFDLVLVAGFLWDLTPSAASHPAAPAWLLGVGAHRATITVLAASGLLSTGFFAARPAAVVPGWVALGLLGLLVEAHAALVEGPFRLFFSGGAAAFGWLVGATYGRATGRERPDAEGLADFGAAAGLAATYVNAVAGKVEAGGLRWTDADALRAIVCAQHPVDASFLSEVFARAVVDHRAVASALVALTVLAQASALAYPWHRRARAASATLLLAFHASTTAMTPLFFPQAMVLLVALSYPWPALVDRIAPRRAPGRPEVCARAGGWRGRAGLVAALGAAVVFAWTSPLRAYSRLHHHHAVDGVPPPAPVAPALAAALGDLVPGARVGAWELRAAEGAGAGVRLGFASGAGTVHVVVQPRGALSYAAPAQTGAFDVFYDRPRAGEAQVTEEALLELVRGVAARIHDPR